MNRRQAPVWPKNEQKGLAAGTFWPLVNRPYLAKLKGLLII